MSNADLLKELKFDTRLGEFTDDSIQHQIHAEIARATRDYRRSDLGVWFGGALAFYSVGSAVFQLNFSVEYALELAAGVALVSLANKRRDYDLGRLAHIADTMTKKYFMKDNKTV